MKELLKNIYLSLEKPANVEYGVLVQNFLLFVILVNITSFIIPNMYELSADSKSFFMSLETFTAWLFAVEIILRYIVIGFDEKYKGFKGRIKYTFNVYTIIDFLAVLPLFVPSNMAFLKFLRFLRILKFLRMKDFLKKRFSLNSFASSSIATQIATLFFLSLFIIMVFSYIYHSIQTSFLIFLSPTEIINTKNIIQLLLGIVELFIGLIVGGFLVSIITSTLVEITNDASKGLLPYKGKEHIIIVNINPASDYILNEINKYYEDNEKKDIVLFIPEMEDIERFQADMFKYENINLFVVAGENLNWASYKRANINNAEKILFLRDGKTILRQEVRYILQNEEFTNKTLEFYIEEQSDDIIESIYKGVFDKAANKNILIKHDKLIDNFLNRTIVNNLYFVIFRELLTFDGFEIYIIESKRLFENEILFDEAVLKISKAVLIGVKRDGKIIINPEKNFVINETDSLIMIMENEHKVQVDEEVKECKLFVKLKPPKLKEDRNICIVGNYNDVNINEITEFLSETSKNKILHKVSDCYMKKELWDEIFSYEYIDAIILNLEDQEEFDVTMYLRNIYKDQPKKLEKIINILKTPIIAKLIEDKKYKNNVILSEKIIGEFISKVLFLNEAIEIFDELTHKYGNEFYILNKEQYPEIFNLNYYDLKCVLIKNGFIYIGAFEGENFIFDYHITEDKDINKIVVLTKGV